MPLAAPKVTRAPTTEPVLDRLAGVLGRDDQFEPPRRSAFFRFLSHVQNLLIDVLLVLEAVTAALGLRQGR